MNILIAGSTPDGPYWLAFNISNLNLELEHHKNLYDAIQLCLKTDKKVFGEGSGTFGLIRVVDGELMDDDCFISNMISAEAEFGDEGHPGYDSRYKKIILEPPFQIDAIIKLRTFY